MGVYRLWRDGGYAVGALTAGLLADLVGIPAAVAAVDPSVRGPEPARGQRRVPLQALEVLSRGRPVLYSVTVPEGYTAAQIAGLLEQTERA